MGPQGRLIQHKSRGLNAGARMCKPVYVPSGDQLPSWCVLSTALLYGGGIFLGTNKQETMFERFQSSGSNHGRVRGKDVAKIMR